MEVLHTSRENESVENFKVKQISDDFAKEIIEKLSKWKKVCEDLIIEDLEVAKNEV